MALTTGVGGGTVVLNPRSAPPPVWSPYDRAPLALHRRLPGYRPTPLLSVTGLAQRYGVGRVWVKSETDRFGLPSFKMLGASWAVYRALEERLGAPFDNWEDLAQLSGQLASARPLVLAAATDGNHGWAVARMARWLGFAARIFVPEGTAAARTGAIAAEGAQVEVVPGCYEDAVARSAQESGPRCLVISDTSWPGYERVPRWVIEGYSTMFWEVTDRLEAAGLAPPDLVIVPIGVGALAGAAANHWSRSGSSTRLVGVEPDSANCAMASAQAGHIVEVPGPHRSIMAGLNCGLPSAVAWPLVSAAMSAFVAVDDDQARQAMRLLAAVGVQAGETGAAALAGLARLQQPDVPEQARAQAGSTVLLLCTEGATDPAQWWEVLGTEVL